MYVGPWVLALEFVMRQPETESALFKGTAYGKKAWRRAHPIEEDEDYWDDIGEAPSVDVAAGAYARPRFSST
jgi:hypothetical protein